MKPCRLISSLVLMGLLTVGSSGMYAAEKAAAQGYVFNTLPEIVQKKLSVAVRGRTDDITQIVRTTLKYTNGKTTEPLYVAKVALANGSIQYLCLNDKGEIVHRETTKPGAEMKGVKQ